MNRIFEVLRRERWFFLILAVSLFLRLKGLTFQSLWFDELHTMNAADPNISWGKLFFWLKCCDVNPPLFYIVERISFLILGYTEFVARFVSAVAGTFSIAAMYWLGKELLNKSLGLIAAILACVNFYNLSYSQEARAYIFAFLFAILSFLFFVKLVKSPSPKHAIGYAVFTLCLLYSHYYGLFALAAQIIPGVVFIFQKKGQERKKLFRLFLLSAVIIAICYAPWIPFLRAAAAVKSFWIGNVDHAFLQNYFSEFFGNSQLLKLVLVALLVVYLFKVVQQAGNGNSFLINDPLVSSFFILFCWVFVAVLIPYVRSLVVLPMLIPRYTIIILPAILMAVAYGIELSGRRILKHSIIVLIVVLSLINILLERKYYSTISKTQFREMTEFLVERNKENYPIINELIAWPQAYYLKKYKSTAEIFGGPKGSIMDSILSKSSPKYNVAGFWLVGAHGDKMPDATMLKNIDTSFFLVYQKQFVDAWAYMFILKEREKGRYAVIEYDQFKEGSTFEQTAAIWRGSIHSAPFSLQKGKYNLVISARGDPAQGQFPHLNIYINNKKIGDYYLTGAIEGECFVFENSEPGQLTLTVEMDNDFYKPGLADRNAFVQKIIIVPMKILNISR